MTAETNAPRAEEKHRKTVYRSPGSDAVYGLGLIGAFIYYVQHATTFMMGVIGLLKAIVWPAFVVFKLLEYFKM